MSTPSSVKITPSVELDLRIVTKTNPPILVTITGCQKRNYDSAFYYRGRLPESFRNLDLLCVKSFTNPNGSENPQDLDSSASADNVSIKRLKLFIPVKHFVKITKEAAEMVEELRKELTEVGDGFHLSAIRVLGHKERLLSKATRDSDITVEYSHDYDIPAKTFAWFVFTPELLDDLIIHLPSLEHFGDQCERADNYVRRKTASISPVRVATSLSADEAMLPPSEDENENGARAFPLSTLADENGSIPHRRSSYPPPAPKKSRRN